MSGKRITKGLRDRLLQRLTEAGALSQERAKALGIFPITAGKLTIPRWKRRSGSACTRR